MNKELQAIWRKHNEHILERMVRSILPASAYQDALELASLQRRLLPPCELNYPLQGPQVNYYQTPAYFRRILRDATLASVTVAAWRGLPHTHVYTDAYGSYYFIRMLVLAGCCDPRARRGGQALKQAIYWALSNESTSTQMLFSCLYICCFICGYARDLEPDIKHGVYTHKKDSGIKDESNDSEDQSADDGESNDAEDQSDDGSEDGSGDSGRSPTVPRVEFRFYRPMMAGRLSGNGQLRYWKRQGGIGWTVPLS